jgi:hypothetical protein
LHHGLLWDAKAAKFGYGASTRQKVMSLGSWALVLVFATMLFSLALLWEGEAYAWSSALSSGFWSAASWCL